MQHHFKKKPSKTQIGFKCFESHRKIVSHTIDNDDGRIEILFFPIYILFQLARQELTVACTHAKMI